MFHFFAGEMSDAVDWGMWLSEEHAGDAESFCFISLMVESVVSFEGFFFEGGIGGISIDRNH